MAISLTLQNLANLQNEITAVNAINANNSAIITALQDGVSRIGNAPNTMSNNLDMNNFTILNLPAPTTTTSPLRLIDLNNFLGGGTITNIPPGGVNHAALVKTSALDYQIGWTAGSLIIANGKTSTTNNTLTFAGTDGTTLTFQGTDTYVSRTSTDTLTNKTLTNATLTNPTTTGGTYNGLTISSTSGASLTIATGKAVALSNSLTLVGTDGTTITFQGTDTYVGRATTDTLTNKTIDTAGPNTLRLSGNSVTLGQLPGTTTNDNAAAGYVGEYVTATLTTGSATALTTATPKTVISINLTAGDWDVAGVVGFQPLSTTSVTVYQAAISLVTNTIDSSAPGNSTYLSQAAAVPNGSSAFGIPPVRYSFSTTTTVYLVAQSNFTVNNNFAFGTIRARRIR